MRINKKNIHVYLQQYHLGMLNEADSVELMQFLALHPEYLENEFSLPEINEIFKNKKSLKKPNEIKLINFVEGNLSRVEENLIKALAENDKILEKEIKLFKQARLIPDKSVLFPHKQRLKKKDEIFIFPLIRWAAVLAGILFLGYLFIRLNDNIFRNTQKTTVANKSNGVKSLPSFTNNPIIQTPHDVVQQNQKTAHKKKSKIINSAQSPLTQSPHQPEVERIENSFELTASEPNSIASKEEAVKNNFTSETKISMEDPQVITYHSIESVPVEADTDTSVTSQIMHNVGLLEKMKSEMEKIKIPKPVFFASFREE
ncbi:MAG: hypothetical protein N3F09_01040 [Bacteroidia bacterium]|nr:hypothetical protein [Bacteroidia bacterium]